MGESSFEGALSFECVCSHFERGLIDGQIIVRVFEINTKKFVRAFTTTNGQCYMAYLHKMRFKTNQVSDEMGTWKTDIWRSCAVCLRGQCVLGAQTDGLF